MYTLKYYPECQSTMDIPATAGTIVYTDKQTAGRGTRNRSWVSKPGNLLCTINYAKPLEFTPELFCLLVGIKIIESIGNSKVKLRWPNDIVINGKKCGGVLITNNGDITKIGIGINLINHPLPTELKEIQDTTSLSELGIAVDPKILMLKIAQKIDANVLSKQQIIKYWCQLADWGPSKYGNPIKLTAQGHLVVQNIESKEIHIVNNAFT